MYYKISEVSQMIGIPIDTIRYYEKMGIISPIRKGTYRAFSDEDIYLLCEYKKMRSYGLSLKEIKDFNQVTRIQDYAGQFETIRDDCEQKVQYYLTLKRSMDRSVNMLQNVEEHVGKYQITEISAKYYIDFFQQKKFNLDKTNIWKSWIHDYYPLVEYIAVWDLADGESENITENSMWVNAIDEDAVKSLNIPVDESVQRISAGKALYTIINRYGERMIDRQFMEEIRRELEERNLVLDGKVIGKMMARIKEGSDILRYIGIWIPVREKNRD